MFYIINPVYDELIIKGKNTNVIDFGYKIYDMSSKLVSEGNSTTSKRIIISNLINGIYILHLMNNEFTESHRIIKRR